MQAARLMASLLHPGTPAMEGRSHPAASARAAGQCAAHMASSSLPAAEVCRVCLHESNTRGTPLVRQGQQRVQQA